MKNNFKLLTAIALLLATTLSMAFSNSPALGTVFQERAPIDVAFTYQGHINVNDELYTGFCDFRFGLWDDPAGGAQIGSSVTKTGVSVTGGAFAVTLDFGQIVAQAAWLEVATRCPAGSGDYITLSPRHAITPAPYALYSASAPWGGLTDIPAGFADGVDNDTIYSAGSGLVLADTSLGIDEEFVGDIISNTLVAGPAWFNDIVHTTISETITSNAQWFTEILSTTIANNPQWFTTIIYQTVISNTVALSGTYQLAITESCPEGYAISQVNDDGTVECEVDTDTTYTAGNGLVLTGATFSVNTVAIQARVSGTCAAGSAISSISSTGTVTCETDDNTTYTAGNGLALTGTTFSVDTSEIQARVSGTCAVGSAIRSISSTGTVTCETDDDTTYGAGDGLTMAGTTLSAVGSPYANVVVVAKSGGDYTTITAALNSITDAGSSNRYLVIVGPGTYSERVTMKQYVDVAGSGESLTFITADTGPTSGSPSSVVVGALFSELRDVTLTISGTGTYGTGLYNGNGATWLRDVTINVNGGTTGRYGIYNAYSPGGTFFHEHVTINLASGSTISAYGVYVGQDNTVWVLDSSINVSVGSTVQRGVHSNSGGTAKVMNTRIVSGIESLYAAAGGTFYVGASYLGAPTGVSGTKVCAGVYTASTYYTNTCP